MIIHLTGAPAAGKSTFAARFVLEHPGFRYVSIDEYRIAHEDEATAWHFLTEDILSRRKVVLESCGMGWKLAELLNLPTLKRRPMITIGLTATAETLHARLNERQKRPLPSPFELEDHHLAIDYHADKFPDEVVCVPHIFDSTGQSKELTYELITQFINRTMLLDRNISQKRRTDIPVQKPSIEKWTGINSRVTEL